MHTLTITTDTGEQDIASADFSSESSYIHEILLYLHGHLHHHHHF